MMVSFFKKKSNGGCIKSLTKAAIESPRVTRAPEDLNTPPVTPEPESPPSLQVLIVTEPKENNSEKYYGSHHSESDFGSSSGSRSVDVQSHTDDSLLSTVISGMGCVPVSELPSWTNRAGGSLITIPENSIISATQLWGLPPSLDSDSGSFESFQRNVHYDNFEMVLDEYSPETDMARKRLEDSMENMASEDQRQEQKQDISLLCQPCNNLNKRGEEMTSKPRNTEVENISRETELTLCHNVSIAAPVKETRKEVKVLEKDDKGKTKNCGSKDGIRSLAKLADTQTPDKESFKKILFHRKSQKIERKSETKSSRFGKLISKRFHKKKDAGKKEKAEEAQLTTSRVTQSRPSKDNKAKVRRWKSATDVETGKVYFYHTGTKKVSWEKPEEFVEWRVTVDLPTGKTCFVNRITKEATWVKPEEVEEWKEVNDSTTGNTYYYNIFTRETTWIKPDESVEPKEDIKTIIPVDKDFEKNNEVLNENAVQEVKNKNITPNATQRNIEKDHSEPVAIVKDIVEDIVEDDATEDSKIFLETELSEHNIDNFSPMDSLNERLASLLSKYCPNDKEMNLQLIQISVGQEKLVIKAIEALVEETPFDELQSSIFCYAKSVIRSMGEEPYDENLGSRERRGPPITLGRSALKRVPTMSSTTFSLNSRAVSHMTGKSGFTNKTNGTAETFRMTNTTKVVNTSLDQSFEEGSTTDEDDGKKLIFDMRLLQEDNFNGKEKLQNKGREKQKAKGAPLPNTSATRNLIKTSKPRTRPMGIKEIDVREIYASEEIESECAADNDNETDADSLNDTISALSDSFGPSHSKRCSKENRLLEKETQKKNVRHLFITSMFVYLYNKVPDLFLSLLILCQCRCRCQLKLSSLW